jgi:A/G-specific adenine glycosylase
MSGFADRVLEWHALHGRHDLPWQQPRTPYRVWLSEIMLQQTQVATVIGFFMRFVDALPSLADLAAADADQVLALWAGLGYYTRARNLHAAAKLCMQRHGGELPRDIEALSALPGIGRSTAGAILAQAHGQRHAILDANVRRVLARHALIEGDVGGTRVLEQLWKVAEQHLPHQRLADYTQAMMDLGATVCSARAPRCSECPVAVDCAARAADAVARIPHKRRAREVPQRATRLLLLHDREGRILLERRPPTGIWGGLWSLPQIDIALDPLAEIARHYGSPAPGATELPPIQHVFTHFKLRLQPLRATLEQPLQAVADDARLRWVDAKARRGLGLPRPIGKLLDQLQES